MRNGKFFNTITRVQNVPRWDEYASRFSDNTASHSYRVALLALLSGSIEQKLFNNHFDIERLVCRAIYHDINETVTGSIKHSTKKDPIVQVHIQNLEREANETIVSYLSHSLQSTFHDFIVSAEDNTPEGRLLRSVDTFDALLFCKRETTESSNFFSVTYTKLSNELRNSEFDSIRWLLDQVENDTPMNDFLMNILMLDRVRRWKSKFNTIYDDDAIHQFRCAAISIFNGYLEKIKYNVDVNIVRLVAKALCHDVVEVLTGDVLGPIKHSSEESKRAFEEYERLMSNKLLDMLPDFLHEDFYDYMVNAKDSSYEGQMVDIADKIDALIKAGMERRINRMEYEVDYRRQLRKIQRNFDNPSVIFFLAYILHDLDYPIFDEIE